MLFAFGPPPSFFSVRRLLGSRQVVTQCLCQLNELCSILHRLLFGSIKREHGPIHSPDIVHVRWRPHETKHTKQANKNHKSTKPNKSKTKQKHQTKTRKNPHRRNGQVSSMRIAAAYVLTVEPCMHRNNTETRKNTIARRPGRVQKGHQRVAETRGPPSQDPGDHNATPTGHNRHPNPRIAIMRYMKETLDQQQAPCRGVQCKRSCKTKSVR